MIYGRSALAFVLGGAAGFSDAVRKRGNDTLSLGPMTLPHRLARVVLVEQIYRALSNAYEGWQNMAHGGIISTLLDEIMAWTVNAFKRVFFVTGRMEVVFLHPVPIGEPITARGEISPEPYDRGCIASGAIVDKNDRILATARAEIVYVPEERLDKLPQHLKDDMIALYAEMEKLCADVS